MKIQNANLNDLNSKSPMIRKNTIGVIKDSESDLMNQLSLNQKKQKQEFHLHAKSDMISCKNQINQIDSQNHGPQYLNDTKGGQSNLQQILKNLDISATEPAPLNPTQNRTKNNILQNQEDDQQSDFERDDEGDEDDDQNDAYDNNIQPKPIMTCSSSSSDAKPRDDGDENSDSSYFESMSSSSSDIQLSEQQEEEILNKMNQMGDGDMSFLFSSRGMSQTDPTVIQQNADALHRFEHGGVVIYDSYARIRGNTHLTTYYENNPPQKIDFNILYSKEELHNADKLFYKEPRERDFQNDFDKFVFKHLPKFSAQRDYGGLAQTTSQQNNQPQQPTSQASNSTGNSTNQNISNQGQKLINSTMNTQNQQQIPHQQMSSQIQNQNYQYTINVPQQENILIFDSRFENGNLRRAMKVNNVEYNLLLENDVNTKGHTQWYYFKVVYRYPKKQKIQFNILNLAKPQSLYSQGMKPCIYSRNQNLKNGKGWFRGGEDIKYFQNDIPRKSGNPTGHFNGANNNFLYNNNGAGEGCENYFTLSFIYEFDDEEDEVWFAHAIPFTFTDLQLNLIKAKKKQQTQSFLRTEILCKTLAGSPCPLLTITDKIDTYLPYSDDILFSKKLPNVVKKQLNKKYQKCKKLYKQSMESRGKVRRLLKAAFQEELNSFYERNKEIFIKIDPKYENYHQKLKQYIIDHYHKKAVIITSRVHPGEPQASYMLQGTIDYLLSEEAAELRKYFVFRIVPMLNPDGVIYGNYRCSLLGVDLNRKWVQPNIFLHPTVFYAKQLVRNMHNERRVLMFCDLHGHSRKQNAFFYACTYKNFEHEGRIKNAQLRIIPLLCCHKNTILKFKDCSFKIQKCKESTARVVVFREFNIMNSFTLECSFYGYEESLPNTIEGNNSQKSLQVGLKKEKIKHFGIKEYISLGIQLAEVLNNYLPSEQSKLNILSGKILDIFYDEFIKFIPPYILKREEERKKQLNLEQANFTPDITNPAPKDIGKSPKFTKNFLNNTSPKGQNIFSQSILSSQVLRSQSIKKPRKSIFQANVQQNKDVPLLQLREPPRTSTNNQIQNLHNESTPKSSAAACLPLSKKSKIEGQMTKKIISKKRRQTFLNKKGIVSAELNLIGGLSSRGEGAHKESETFSQIINIHPSQDEIIELETFIKGVKLLQESKFKNDESGIEEEEDEDGEVSDSSDEEAIQKSYFSQQKIQKQYGGAGGIRKSGHFKEVKKSKAEGKAGEELQQQLKISDQQQY